MGQEPEKIELVVLDMAGTTVRDDGLVEKAFVLVRQTTELLSSFGDVDAVARYARETMGQSKITVFRALTNSEEEAHLANEKFEESYAALVQTEAFEEIPGAAHALKKLRERGLKLALTTGFSDATQQLILDRLNWNGLVDFALTPAAVGGRGRPFPDLNLAALIKTETTGVANLAVVGDTTSDMISAVRAGAALRIGVLSGAHRREALLAAGANEIINSVAELPELLSDF